jgi:hypothetical protein
MPELKHMQNPRSNVRRLTLISGVLLICGSPLIAIFGPNSIMPLFCDVRSQSVFVDPNDHSRFGGVLVPCLDVGFKLGVALFVVSLAVGCTLFLWAVRRRRTDASHTAQPRK